MALTLIDLCCWDLSQPELADRHCVSREMLHEKFLAALPRSLNRRKFQTLFEALVTLALGSPKVQSSTEVTSPRSS